MSKASQIILLCEDKAHKVFIERFLKRGWDVHHRAIRPIPYPQGKGSGKKHVLDSVAEQVNICRTRSASTILIVAVDADEKSVDQMEVSLGITRSTTEPIVYVIPKWHIETWLAYLDDGSADETEQRKYKNKYNARSKAVYPLIDDLAGRCKRRDELASPPESLVKACEEFERVRGVLT